MYSTVPFLSIVFMAFSMLMGIAIPLVAVIFLRKKYGCGLLSFWIGAAVMLVFALILEQLAHKLVLSSALGGAIQANIWLTGLYGGFMAGLFEESGRFIAFKTLLRKSGANDHNAIMYGAGHGGFEAFYLLVFGMINNLIYSVMLNTGNTSLLTQGLSGDTLTTIETAFSQLAAASPALFLIGVLERLAAFAAQLSLSVLVWFGAKKGGRSFWLYPLAIVLHLVLDAGAVILNSYVSNVMLVELAIWVFAALCVGLAVVVWRKNHKDNTIDAVEEN